MSRGVANGRATARRAWGGVALVAVGALLAVVSPAGAAVGGGLKQLPGTKGCIVDETSVPLGCEDVRAMQDISDLAMSPGGESVYVSSIGKDAIAAFDRNASTGELTQKTTITGCITSSAAVSSSDTCNLIPDANALVDVNSIALSPDGKSLYTVNNAGLLAAFDRAADGTLSFNEIDSCCNTSSGGRAITVSPDGASVYAAGPWYNGLVEWLTRNTTPGPNLGDIAHGACYGGVCGGQQNLGTSPTALAVTADNKELLIASSDNSTVLGWNRASNGALTPSSTPSRCVAPTTLTGTCQARAGQLVPRSLALAPDGAHVYVGSEQSVSTINRDPVTNDLAPDLGASCFGYPTSNFAGCSNVPGASCCSTFYPAREVVATPDGNHVYLGTEATAPAIFGFTRASGGLALNTSAFGCTSVNGVDGCAGFRQGNGIKSMSPAPDSRQLYAAGNNRLFTFALDRPPACADVSANIAHNTTGPVQLNCSDPDGDSLTYEIVNHPARGNLGSVQGNSVNYGPLVGTSGADSFTYRALASGTPSDAATATVQVGGPAPDESCEKAKKKLKKAKKKLKELKADDDAKAAQIKKAAKKVKKLKKKVKQACA